MKFLLGLGVGGFIIPTIVILWLLTMPMKRCRECGTPVEHQYCPYCGTKADTIDMCNFWCSKNQINTEF